MSFSNLDPATLLFATLGGILPAFVWLGFWLKEDARRPEPKRLLVAAFLAGIISVGFALFFERLAHNLLGSGVLLFISWAAIEELLKYGGAYLVAFRRFCVDGSGGLDRPVDPAVY